MGILDVFKKPEAPVSPSSAVDLSLSHEGAFVAQALAQAPGAFPTRCRLVEPGENTYPAFLRFMAQNIERLSHAIELGYPFIGSEESRQVLQSLTGFMRYQQRCLFRGEGWAKDLGGSMELPVAQGFSVARTEIYPEQGVEGVCYHARLDLHRGDRASPIIILERYMVSQGDRFRVVRDGTFALGILSGALTIDLDASPVEPNVVPRR